MTSNSVSLNQFMSFAQSAYFFNALQNYKYAPYSVECGFLWLQKDGGCFSIAEINDALAGDFNNGKTYPQLNIGVGDKGQRMPLSIFKNLHENLRSDQTYAYENSAGIQGYLNFFRNEFAERPRGYPEGISSPNSNGAVYLWSGALKMYQEYPYISVNYLKKKGQRWLNMTRPANNSITDTNNVGKTFDNKGSQFAIFNEQMPDQGSLRINNDGLQVADAKEKSTRQFKPGGGARYEFPYIPAASRTPLNFSITYESTDTITKERTSGTSGSWSETSELQIGFKKTTPKGLEISTGSTELTGSFTQTLQTSGKWDEALKKGSSQIEKGTLKVDFSPSNFKPGSKLANVMKPPSGVSLANPNDILEEGGTYIAEFIVSKSNISAPSSGLTTINGAPGVFAPRSMQYQSAGRDKGRANWSIDGTKPDGKLEGRNSAFWAEKFLQSGGPLAYGLEEAKIINSNGEVTDQKAVTFDSDKGTAEILALANMTAELNYDIKLKVSRVHNAEFDTGETTLMALNSSSTIDIDEIGQENMPDFYRGNHTNDSIDGSIEGGDGAETGDGNDRLTNFIGSYLDSGNGNDSTSLQKGYGNNTIYLGDGDDEADIASSGNFIDLGLGQDTIKLSNQENCLNLGYDNDKDHVIFTHSHSQLTNNLSVENLDLGKDIFTGFSSTEVQYSYDSFHRMITGNNPNIADVQSQYWLHPDEDLNISFNEHRLFLQLISNSHLTTADRVFIENDSLSDGQWDAFIERFVFTEEHLDAENVRGVAMMDRDVKQLLNNPDLQSLGRAIWEAVRSSEKRLLKMLISSKLIDLGVPEIEATEIVRSSLAVAAGLLERTITDISGMAKPSESAFRSAAESFLVEASSQMEEYFHAIAFPTDQIDPLTGLAITPSADDNTISGTDSNDWIRGGSGDDFIKSGAGNDAVRAGAGNDEITLGKGRDNLIITIDQLDGSTDMVTDFNEYMDYLLVEDALQIDKIDDREFMITAAGSQPQAEKQLILILDGFEGELRDLNIDYID